MVKGLFPCDNDLEAEEVAALFAWLISLWLGSPASSDLEAVDDISFITVSCLPQAIAFFVEATPLGLINCSCCEDDFVFLKLFSNF